VHPLLALADRLWALDVPAPETVAALLGVRLELYEDKFGYQRFRGAHPLGAIDAGWRALGGYGYVSLVSATKLDIYTVGFRDHYGLCHDRDLNPNISPSGVDSDIYRRSNGRVDMWWPVTHGSMQSLGFTVNYGPPTQIYLPSYDRADEVLSYNPSKGSSKVLPRQSDHVCVLGAFVREKAQVTGVYASPGGPVFFLDSKRVAVRFGEPTVTAIGGTFKIVVDRREQIAIDYAERHGIGTNPYDREPADVDLYALMARGAQRPEWWAAYTKPWVP